MPFRDVIGHAAPGGAARRRGAARVGAAGAALRRSGRGGEVARRPGPGSGGELPGAGRRRRLRRVPVVRSHRPRPARRRRSPLTPDDTGAHQDRAGARGADRAAASGPSRASGGWSPCATPTPSPSRHRTRFSSRSRSRLTATMFVLTSAAPDALLRTVRSRTMRLAFGRLTTDDLVRLLVRDHGYAAAEARAGRRCSPTAAPAPPWPSARPT